MTSSSPLPASASFARLASHVSTDAAALQAGLSNSVAATIKRQQAALQQRLSGFDSTGMDAQTFQRCMSNAATADVSCRHADQAAQQCSAGAHVASAPIHPTFDPVTPRAVPTQPHLRSPFSPNTLDNSSPHFPGAWDHTQGPSMAPSSAPTHRHPPPKSLINPSTAAAASHQNSHKPRRPPKVPLFHESPARQPERAAAPSQGPVHANDSPHANDFPNAVDAPHANGASLLAAGASEQPDSETAASSPSLRTSPNFTELAKLAAGVVDALEDEVLPVSFDPAGLGDMAELHENIAGQAKPIGRAAIGPAAVPMQQSTQPSKRPL